MVLGLVNVSANIHSDRLNMFGFPGSPATQQNLGILDMRMAIEWVSQNIAQFGGDPDRIVLFGQAAGAMAVDILLHAYPDDPLVKGAILQSGSATTFEALGPPSAQGAATHWSRTAANLSCADDNNNDDDAAVLSCMRGKPAADLLAAQFPAAASVPGRGSAQTATRGGFVPTVDGVTVFGDYATGARRVAPVPILIGTTDNEGGLAQALGLANAGIDIVIGDGTATGTDREDAVYDCPSARRAEKARAGGWPVWRYRFFGSFPNTQLLAEVESGAWHGSEVGVLFGTNQVVEPNTAEEDAVGALMRGMWAAFAKDPAGGLNGFMGGVSRYSADNDSLIRLGYENKADLTFAGGDSYDGDCAQLEAAPGAPQPAKSPSDPDNPTQVASGRRTIRLNSWILSLAFLLTSIVSSL